MLRFALLMLIAALVAACCPGCSSLDGSAKALRPQSRDYADYANDEREFNDEWASVGMQARADQATDHEADGLSKYLQSPKARSINRSLGVE